jgi:hypothetical protein
MADGGRERNKLLWACGLLVAVSFLAYARVWNAYFLADDFAYAEVFFKDWTSGIWGYRSNRSDITRLTFFSTPPAR